TATARSDTPKRADASAVRLFMPHLHVVVRLEPSTSVHGNHHRGSLAGALWEGSPGPPDLCQLRVRDARDGRTAPLMFGSLMVFTDQVFTFLFLPLALGGLLVAVRLRAKVVWLLLSSLAFYAYSAGAYTLLLLGAIVVSYLAGRWVTGPRGRLVKVASLFLL